VHSKGIAVHEFVDCYGSTRARVRLASISRQPARSSAMSVVMCVGGASDLASAFDASG
jgi:hypothetical protein